MEHFKYIAAPRFAYMTRTIILETGDVNRSSDILKPLTQHSLFA